MPDLIQDTYQLLQRYGLLAIPQALEFARSNYFYRDSLVDHFIWRYNPLNPVKGLFIDHARALDYHPEDVLQVTLQRGEARTVVCLPYKEEINFVTKPEAKIVVAGEITEYVMPFPIRQATEQNLFEFRKAKKKAVDSPVLRMTGLKKLALGNYECALQSATYYAQARTNLTIDFPLGSAPQQTLRDLDMGPERHLRNLEESILANSIGVSAVVFFRRNRIRYFFMKIRNPTEGLFENVFGSVSGVVQIMQGQRVPELISYVQQEIRRELTMETGIDNDNSRIKQVIPLAFARELTRGGKPQFFFLIELFDLDEKKFRRRFRRSAEGLDEFYDGLIRNKTGFPTSLSSELMTNLVYTRQFFQKQQNTPIDPIILDA